jgi:phosphonate transport system substrate-binding protein
MDPKWKGTPSAMLLITAVCTVFISSGYNQSLDVQNISLQKSARIQTVPATTKRIDSLKIAVSAMRSPKETFVFYKEILAYLSQKPSLPIQLIQRKTYEEINTLLRENELDAAFVCTGPYVTRHNDFGMELLVAPVVPELDAT